MTRPKISESEWSVMEVLWERAPRTASEVVEVVQPTTGWAPNTVRTLLSRLVKKGALATGKDSAGVREFSPVLDREAVVREEGQSFVDRVFKGAPQSLLVHFVGQSKLKPEEVEQLRQLLDECQETQC